MKNIVHPQAEYMEILLALQLAWLPIATAPKDGSEILLYLGKPYNRVGKFRWFDRLENWQEDEFPSEDDEYCGLGSEVPTHWMPVPPSPNYYVLPPTNGGPRVISHPDGSSSTLFTEYEQKLEDTLGAIRDIFPIPKSGELHALWMNACDNPLAVPAYIKASYEALAGTTLPSSQTSSKKPNAKTIAAMREADQIMDRRKK